MAYNLHLLSILCDERDWAQRSRAMLTSLGNAIIRYPGSFGNWACLLQEIIQGTNEIVVTGENLSVLHREILKQFIPHRVMMVTEKPDNNYPLLEGKQISENPTIYLCRSYTCLNPVFSAKELMSLINKGQKQ